MSDTADAVVIGAGPNGLVAAATLARKGWDVVVLERNAWAGGAVHSETLGGAIVDPYSAFYGLLHASPVFSELNLGERVRWAHFDAPISAAVGPRDTALIYRDDARTAAGLGADAEAWRELTEWWDRLGTRFFAQMLAPVGAVRPALRFARAAGIRGGIDAARMFLAPVAEVARQRFGGEAARALFASGITHSDLSVDSTGSTPMALILCMISQRIGMPVPVGGAGALAAGFAAAVTDNGGRIVTGEAATRVVVSGRRARIVETASGGLFRARHAVLADTGPLALVHDLVGDEHFPARYLDGLRRFRYGTGIFKVDLVLDGPVRWLDPEFNACGVVHLTGDLDAMGRAAFEAHHHALPAEPLLIVGQQSVADPTRAPDGRATLWIETHVPPDPRRDGGSDATFTGWADAAEPFLERVLARIEEHAPGTRDRIVATRVRTPVDLEAENPNLVGGDLGGGSSGLDMQLVFRPVPGWFRYRTPVRGLYLCSASTHPGGGVHGMCGRNAARRALRDSLRPAGLLRTAGSARRSPRR